MNQLDKEYAAAKRAQAAKRTGKKASKKTGKKASKKASKTKTKRKAPKRTSVPKHLSKADAVALACAILEVLPVRHGVGSPGVDRAAKTVVAHVRRRKAPKAAIARKAPKRKGRKVAKVGTKSNRSRRPRETFKAHMARLRKMDGR